jgi:hypothetical protein
MDGQNQGNCEEKYSTSTQEYTNADSTDLFADFEPQNTTDGRYRE